MEDSPMVEGSPFPGLAPVARRLAPYIAAVVIGAAGFGYALHERHDARSLAAQNQQEIAQLNITHSQLAALTAKVNALTANSQASGEPSPVATKPSPSVPFATPATAHRIVKHRAGAQDMRFKKLQSQVDAQGREIDQTRADLASTRTDLSGSIARTHGELVLLEKKGERNYYEFDLLKSKQFRREGPLSVSLRKANTKHQYADVQLIVDDRTLSQKHVNLYQPVEFFEPDSQQPVEVVINEISKNHIHGYISAPKYRQSELAAASGDGAGSADQQANSSAQPTLRQRLPLPGDMNQQ